MPLLPEMLQLQAYSDQKWAQVVDDFSARWANPEARKLLMSLDAIQPDDMLTANGDTRKMVVGLAKMALSDLILKLDARLEEMNGRTPTHEP